MSGSKTNSSGKNAVKTSWKQTQTLSKHDKNKLQRSNLKALFIYLGLKIFLIFNGVVGGIVFGCFRDPNATESDPTTAIKIVTSDMSFEHSVK